MPIFQNIHLFHFQGVLIFDYKFILQMQCIIRLIIFKEKLKNRLIIIKDKIEMTVNLAFTQNG